MNIDEATSLLEAHADCRVLHRLGIADAHVFAENVGDERCGRLAVIDTGTTGLKPELGDRIVLAIATCEYGRENGRLYHVADRCESLENPEAPIPPEIVRPTGITDEMVRGQRIDERGIARFLEGVGLVICHNARVDRAFLGARYPAVAGMHSACSLEEIPRDRWNMGSAKLDCLGHGFGPLHEGHRARADAESDHGRSERHGHGR
jgi:DNA polymerase-3 subunit epsilon